METEKSIGKIRKIVLGKRYGFIEPENSSNDIFFHFTNILTKTYFPKVGDKISFDITYSRKGEQATNIELVEKNSKINEQTQNRFRNNRNMTGDTTDGTPMTLTNPAQTFDEKDFNPKHRNRNPKIVLAGKVGVGKSTTINTLFGNSVSNTSNYKRGTDSGEEHVLTMEQGRLDITDLPGLGDTASREKYNINQLKEHASKADAVIIILSAPRFIDGPATSILQIVNSVGKKPDKILLALNNLRIFLSSSGVDLDPGVATLDAEPSAKYLLNKLIDDVLKELKKESASYQFEKWQVVPFDAATGWNLNKVFFGLTRILPSETLYSLSDFYLDAFESKRNRDKNETERLKSEVQRKIDELKALELQNVATQKLIDNQKRLLQKEINDVEALKTANINRVPELERRIKRKDGEVRVLKEKIDDLTNESKKTEIIFSRVKNDLAALEERVEVAERSAAEEEKEKNELRNHIKKKIGDVLVSGGAYLLKQAADAATGGATKVASGFVRAISWLMGRDKMFLLIASCFLSSALAH